MPPTHFVRGSIVILSATQRCVAARAAGERREEVVKLGADGKIAGIDLLAAFEASGGEGCEARVRLQWGRIVV